MTMPFLIVAAAVQAEMAAALIGKAIAGRPVTTRPHRHRDSRTDERPVVALRIVSVDISDLGQQTNSFGTPEMLMELTADLVIDCDLDPDADDVTDMTGDPFGFEPNAQILEWLLDRFFPNLEAGAAPNDFGGTVWQAFYDGTSPDEADADEDRVRMEERLRFVFRVRADRPQQLLTGS